MILTSATNPRIKEVVKLHTTKGRKEANRFILEGKRALTSTSLQLETLFCTEEQYPFAQTLTKDIILVTYSLMKKISTTKSPSGLLGIFHIPPNPPSYLLTPGIVLAHITDPGNMGTLIRTAAACNLQSVVIIEGCDPWSPKVVQASAGSSVNLFQWSWEELLSHKKALQLTALVVKNGAPPSSIYPSKALIIVGNEAHGIPPHWLEQCDKQITLPMPGETESLNAAIAGSIAMYLTFVMQLD